MISLKLVEHYSLFVSEGSNLHFHLKMQDNLISCFVVLPAIASQYSNLSLLIIILYLYFNSFMIFYGPFSDHCSAHVKESKIVLYSGFHAVDSGFQVVDLSMELGFVRGNLDSTSKHFPDS